MEELERKHGNMLTHWAAQENRIDVLEWALQHGHDLFSIHVQCAGDGRLDTLIWLKDNGMNIKKEIVTLYASIGGHLHILEWLKTQGFIADLQKRDNDLLFDRFCTYTALKGKLNSLQWLRNNGFPWDEMVCKVAAQYGQFHVLKWAREHGCPWDDKTCDFAASSGHLHILKWAREHGCPWSVVTYRSAVKNHHLPVVVWAMEHKCPVDQTITCTFLFIQFVASKKCLERNYVNFVNRVGDVNVFVHHVVANWIKRTKQTCDDLTYPDLSDLITQFI